MFFDTRYYWKVIPSNSGGQPTDNKKWGFRTENETNVDDEVVYAFKSRLLGNFPNPFNPYTTILFTIENVGNVEINVYDVRGRLIRTLLDGGRKFESGIHSVTWDGRDENSRTVSSGLYFYRMTAGEYTETRRILLMK